MLILQEIRICPNLWDTFTEWIIVQSGIIFVSFQPSNDCSLDICYISYEEKALGSFIIIRKLWALWSSKSTFSMHACTFKVICAGSYSKFKQLITMLSLCIVSGSNLTLSGVRPAIRLITCKTYD